MHPKSTSALSMHEESVASAKECIELQRNASFFDHLLRNASMFLTEHSVHTTHSLPAKPSEPRANESEKLLLAREFSNAIAPEVPPCLAARQTHSLALSLLVCVPLL